MSPVTTAELLSPVTTTDVIAAQATTITALQDATTAYRERVAALTADLAATTTARHAAEAAQRGAEALLSALGLRAIPAISGRSHFFLGAALDHVRAIAPLRAPSLLETATMPDETRGNVKAMLVGMGFVVEW